MNLRQKLGYMLLKGYSDGGSLIGWETFERAFSDWIKLGNQSEDYVGAVFAAIDTWGLYFAKAKHRLYKVKGNRTIEVKDHKFLNLFNEPNSYQSGWEIKYKRAGHYGLFGNSYLHVQRNVINKEPEFYQQLIPSLVNRKFNDKGKLVYYEYYNGINKEKIPVKDIIDFRYPDPRSDRNGYAIVSSVLSQKKVDELQMSYLEKFYQNGGFLGLMFSTKQEMTKANFNRVKQMLQDEYMGQENAYNKVGLFDNDLKPIKAAYSPKDMDIAAARRGTKDDIYEAFKVSRIHVGSGELANRASNDAAIYQFTSGVMDPVLDYDDDVLTRFVRREFGAEYKVIHDKLAPKDQEASMSYYSSMSGMGAMTINEVREEESWDKFNYELADVPLVNVGGAIVRLDTGKQLAVENEEKTEEKEDKETDKESNDGGNDNTGKEKSYYKSGDAINDLRWKQFNRALGKSVRRFNHALDGYTDAQKRRILEAVKDNYIVGEVFNLQEEDMLLWQLLEIEVYSIIEAGHRYGAFRYDISPSLYNKDYFSNIYTLLGENAVMFNTTTFESLKGIEADNADDFKKGISGVYRNIGDRIKTAAVTTATGSFNAGLLKAIKDAGFENKTWLTMRDGRVRTPEGRHLENHVEMDGVTVGIDEAFRLKNRAGGYDLMQYPGDPSGSLENIINDRCTIVGE